MASEPPQTRTPISTRLATAIRRNNLTNFKKLVTPSNWFKFKEENGDNLLHLAIRNKRWMIFQRLTSFPNLHLLLEEENGDGQTPLFLAVKLYESYDWGEEPSLRFIKRLMDRGANCSFSYPNGDNVITHLLRIQCEGYDYEEDSRFIDELIALLLCYGASPWTEADHNEGTNLSFELAAQSGFSFLIETLFLYTFEEDSSFVMSTSAVAKLVEKKSPYLLPVLECIKALVEDEARYYPRVFYEMDAQCWEILLEKPGAFLLLPSEFDCDFEDTSLDTLSVIFDSRLKFDAAESLYPTRPLKILRQLLESGKNEEEVTQYFCFFLSYGLNVCKKSFQFVWEQFQDCFLLRIMLHMDFQVFQSVFFSDKFKDPWTSKLFPELLSNVNVDIYDCIKSHSNSELDLECFLQLLNHSALPEAKKLLRCVGFIGPCLKKIKGLPRVPLLQELSRNCLKKFLVTKFKIETPRRYYTVVKNLSAPEVIKKIITFETPLY